MARAALTVVLALGCLAAALAARGDLEALAEDSVKDGVYEFALTFPPLRYINASGGLVTPTAIK